MPKHRNPLERREMADPIALSYLDDPKRFRELLSRNELPMLDYRDHNIKFDFSCTTLRVANFSNSNLGGSSFARCELNNCNFSGSDWTNCDFSNATFNECNLSKIRNAHLARGLHTIRANGILMNFETAKRPVCNQYFDWEHIKNFGKLPLFTASGIAIVLIPIYFYLIDICNRNIEAFKKAVIENIHADAIRSTTRELIRKIEPLDIPALSLEMLISAIFLFIASSLYTIFCPQRIKEFSMEKWCHDINKPLITYWPHAWRLPLVRLFVFILYLSGGALALWVLAIKLFDTAGYIWRNM